MKKFLLNLMVVGVLFCISSPAFAGVDKRVVLNATVPEVEKIVTDVIDMYNGTITIRERNTKEHRYVVDYNGTTFLGILGLSNKNWSNDKYIRGSFSCKLQPINNGKDVLITNVKYAYRTDIIFNHYKRVYKELEFNGKEVVKYKNYIEEK